MNTQPTSRIRMGQHSGQTPPNAYDDFEWIRQNETDLLARYGECSIIVYQKQVIGVGETYSQALANAEQNLAESAGQVTPVHQWLHHRPTISRMHQR